MRLYFHSVKPASIHGLGVEPVITTDDIVELVNTTDNDTKYVSATGHCVKITSITCLDNEPMRTVIILASLGTLQIMTINH